MMTARASPWPLGVEGQLRVREDRLVRTSISAKRQATRLSSQDHHGINCFLFRLRHFSAHMRNLCSAAKRIV